VTKGIGLDLSPHLLAMTSVYSPLGLAAVSAQLSVAPGRASIPETRCSVLNVTAQTAAAPQAAPIMVARAKPLEQFLFPMGVDRPTFA
jgi:hypothetical protein